MAIFIGNDGIYQTTPEDKTKTPKKYYVDLLIDPSFSQRDLCDISASARAFAEDYDDEIALKSEFSQPGLFSGRSTLFPGYKIFYDAPIAIVVVDGLVPLFGTFFQPRKNPRNGLTYLDVKQLQRFDGGNRVMPVKRWEKYLVGCVEDFATSQDMQRVTIRPSSMNSWNSKERESRFKMRYDVTAKRSGYRYREEDLRYVKDL
jgi:hypothetical protein